MTLSRTCLAGLGVLSALAVAGCSPTPAPTTVVQTVGELQGTTAAVPTEGAATEQATLEPTAAETPSEGTASASPSATQVDTPSAAKRTDEAASPEATVTETDAAQQPATPSASGAAAATPSSTAVGPYRTYVNALHGFRVDYPSWMQAVESDNGDGITVTAPTGGTMRAYAMPTPDAYASELETLRGALAAEGVKITYARDAGAAGITLSGTKGRDIVYARYRFGGGDVPTTSVVRWDYPASMKKAYDPIVTRSAQSLTAPAG